MKLHKLLNKADVFGVVMFVSLILYMWNIHSVFNCQIKYMSVLH